MNYADMVFLSSAIFDSIHDTPFEGGVAVKGDRILAVGARQEMGKYIGADTIVYDMGDRLISPGFCDGHIHLDGAAQAMFAQLVEGLDDCRSEGECAEKVAAFVVAHPNANRIVGMGWSLPSWQPPVPPTRASLDAVAPDIPVYLRAADCHTLWINTAAMKECDLKGLMDSHPEFPAEWAAKDENGEFTGCLSETACHMVFGFAEQYTKEQREGFQESYLRFIPRCGITAVTEVTPVPVEELPALFRKPKDMENNGALPVRIYAWSGTGPEKESDGVEEAKKIKAFSEDFNTDYVRIAGLKGFVDGIPFMYTAALLEPYADKPDTRGELQNTPETFVGWTTNVNALGLAVKYHCIGDRAVRTALDSFEASNAVNDNTGLRNAVEHLDSIDYEEMLRFNRLGVVASVQPAHLIMCKGIHRVREGEERARREFNFRKLIGTGTHIAIGTDAPVVDIDPYVTIYKAVTRLDLDGTQYSPDTVGEAMTLTEVIKGYTVGCAYANNMESKVGTLEPGKYADIVVSNCNLFDIDPIELKNCYAVMTLMGGKVTYRCEDKYQRTFVADISC